MHKILELKMEYIPNLNAITNTNFSKHSKLYQELNLCISPVVI